MPITITTTTVVETLDDLTDALEALREISVDHLEIAGTIDFLALAQERHDRMTAAADELVASPAVQREASDLIERARVVGELTHTDAARAEGWIGIPCPSPRRERVVMTACPECDAQPDHLCVEGDHVWFHAARVVAVKAAS